MAHDSNETLGSLPGRYRLHFNCTNSPRCHFNKRMDIAALIAELGADFHTGRLYDVLRCPECRGRKFLIICTPVHFSYPSDP